ncbi:response regulator [Luedemannella flava]
MRAIVIDDSRAMRLILRRIVGQLGFDVIEAEDGKAALDTLNSESEVPNLALVDWNMPNMNGLEFVTAVRADGRFKDMTLVMVTTESEQSQIVRAPPRAPTSTSSSPSPRAPCWRSWPSWASYRAERPHEHRNRSHRPGPRRHRGAGLVVLPRH